MHNLFSISHFLASAGGGGSGDSDGEGASLFVMIGYFPSYYAGKMVKKFLPRSLELVVSAVTALLASLIVLWIGLLSGGRGFFASMEIVVGVWVGWAAAFFGVWDRLMKKAKIAKGKLDVAREKDSFWDESAMTDYAKVVFLQFQQDWTSFNVENMKTYLSPNYTNHAMLLQAALKQLGRANSMSEVEITNALIIEVYDDDNNQHDRFDIALGFKSKDVLVDEHGNIMHESNQELAEVWHFVRSDRGWLLDGITPQTAKKKLASQSLIDLAAKNNMYYSLDMGRLLVPRGSAIFYNGLGLGDVNNHIIGMYHDQVIQIYTYRAGRSYDSWMILQIALPKQYGSILLQSKKVSWMRRVRNPYVKLEEHSFEWPDFNKRYIVEASDADRLAAFELINPSFMAYLYDNDPGIGIEVVDNIVYIFKSIKSSQAADLTAEQYQIMLNILFQAFKELKM